MLLKVFEIRRINELVEVRQLGDFRNLTSDYEKVLVIYESIPEYTA